MNGKRKQQRVLDEDAFFDNENRITSSKKTFKENPISTFKEKPVRVTPFKEKPGRDRSDIRKFCPPKYVKVKREKGKEVIQIDSLDEDYDDGDDTLNHGDARTGNFFDECYRCSIVCYIDHI